MGIFYPIVKPFNPLFINLKYGDDKDLSAVDGINSVSIPVLVISAEEDLFYGGKSPIYDKQNEIINPNCTFVLMDKELYREHDADVMNMIIEFFNN